MYSDPDTRVAYKCITTKIVQYIQHACIRLAYSDWGDDETIRDSLASLALRSYSYCSTQYLSNATGDGRTNTNYELVYYNYQICSCLAGEGAYWCVCNDLELRSEFSEVICPPRQMRRKEGDSQTSVVNISNRTTRMCKPEIQSQSPTMSSRVIPTCEGDEVDRLDLPSQKLLNAESWAASGPGSPSKNKLYRLAKWSGSFESLPRTQQFVLLTFGMFLFFGLHNVLQEAMMKVEGFEYGVMLGYMEVLG